MEAVRAVTRAERRIEWSIKFSLKWTEWTARRMCSSLERRIDRIPLIRPFSDLVSSFIICAIQYLEIRYSVLSLFVWPISWGFFSGNLSFQSFDFFQAEISDAVSNPPHCWVLKIYIEFQVVWTSWSTFLFPTRLLVFKSSRRIFARLRSLMMSILLTLPRARWDSRELIWLRSARGEILFI